MGYCDVGLAMMTDEELAIMDEESRVAKSPYAAVVEDDERVHDATLGLAWGRVWEGCDDDGS